MAESILDYQGETSHVATGRPAEHALGVAYEAPWERPADGFHEHVRRCARALAMTGCPVHLRSLRPGLLAEDEASLAVQRSVESLTTASIARFSVQVHQVVPTERLLQRIVFHPKLTAEENAAVNRFRVLYTVWERDPIPESAVVALKLTGQAWVACELDAKRLRDAGVERVRVIPVPFFSDDPHLALRSKRPTRSGGPPRFYHIGKWEPRKGQHEMIGAFLKAFRPGEAELYMRSGEAPGIVGYPTGAMVSLFGWLENADVRAMGWTVDAARQWVRIYGKRMPAEELVKLHGHCDVYLSLSRGEGFDMPAFDAKLSGNRMLYTESGGPMDFSGPEDYAIVPDGAVPCHPMYEWPGATYLDFDERKVIAGMREMVRRVRGWDRGTARRDLSWFSAEQVGRRMMEHLMELIPSDGLLFDARPPAALGGVDHG